VSPSPQKYNIKGDIEERAIRNRGYSFGQSREKFKKVYLKENPPIDESVPGPGNYKTNYS
jgi:hypothetical protein